MTTAAHTPSSARRRLGFHMATIVASRQRLRCYCTDRQHTEIATLTGSEVR